MESDISGSLDQPELIISQVFELDDMFGFCQDIFGLNRSVSLSTSIIFFMGRFLAIQAEIHREIVVDFAHEPCPQKRHFIFFLPIPLIPSLASSLRKK